MDNSINPIMNQGLNQSMNLNLNQNDEIEIDLKEIFFLLLHNAVLIILASLSLATIFFIVSRYIMTPIYESTTKIYILSKQNEATLTYTDVQLGTQLTKDYAELIKSRYVLEEVIDELGLDLEYEQMLGVVEVATPTDTRILSIAVKDKDPVMAMNIANAIRDNSAVHIQNVMDIEAVNIVETANLPVEPTEPSVMKFTLLGAVVGGMLVVMIVLIRFITNDTVKTSDDVEKYLQLSTLAVIPRTETTKKSKKKIRK
ncbi:MAG: Wzz/FepE/Etk N-terminal domain-containing protein [Lachnospiraceae bacterium]|nr:Wzz/FepE/Etk N-terminal domain-containing protein [Lachnospiraceae bacterium]